jgi:hypothetical protein
VKAEELHIWSLPLITDFALALQPASKKNGCYERIGAISWRSSQDDDFSMAVQTITIV